MGGFPMNMLYRYRNAILLGILAFLLVAYVTSYIVLSRRGFAMSKALGCEGFYFFPPEDTDSWRRTNYGLAKFYYPLIVIDNWIGTGMPVGHEPLWKLSRTDHQLHSWICKLDSPRGRGG
jgi:hypothetical protein